MKSQAEKIRTYPETKFVRTFTIKEWRIQGKKRKNAGEFHSCSFGMTIGIL